MNKKIWKIIFCIGVIVCVICLGLLGWNKYQAYRLQKELEVIENSQYTQRDGQEPELPEGVRHGESIDFDKLQKINKEVYAWVYVPGTRIDYPVAQNAKDDSHYLKYNYKNEPEFAGCIYTERLNKKDFTDPNTVLYGHNMRNGSMFQNLHKFEEKSFFRKHTEIYIYTPKKTYIYKIFAAYKYDSRHLLKSFNFDDKKVFKNYLANVMATREMISNIRTDVKVTENDRIITLSTCVGGQPDNRYLVQAVLTDEREAK
ncbi:class B sortase [Anaerostipes sp.]|uniref:class B sortase n=1 Tax=Anaerostipes sp. TaxID=1872530 RepID=UPI00258B6E8B|nr:class B sortase [Anaerostipes sp.]MCI5624024.1 class B sortase [Anaerostipes sp.]MDY2726939.1 class B sortase [Anaerostipes faecalis]